MRQNLISMFLLTTSVPLSTAALTDVRIVPVDNSGALDGYVTQDLVFTTDTRMLGAAIYMRVGEGNFYNHDAGFDSLAAPEQLIELFPAVEFDTFLDGPTDRPVLFPGGPSLREKQIYANWAALGSREAGEIRAARLTLSDSANEGQGLVRIVTELENQSFQDSFFFSVENGTVALEPYSTQAIRSGNQELNGTYALTAIENPETRVVVPPDALVMNEFTFEAPLVVSDRAVLEFTGGSFYNPSNTGTIIVHTGAELDIQAGFVQSRRIQLANEAKFEMSGGTLSMAVGSSSPSTVGVYAEHSDISISGGDLSIGVLSSHRNTLAISGGDITVASHAEMRDAVGTISGGMLNIQENFSVVDSQLHLTGGSISIGYRLDVMGGSVIISGDNFNFPSGPLTAESGTVTGILDDGTPLTFDYQLSQGGTIILNAPEPNASVLTGFCILAVITIRRRRR